MKVLVATLIGAAAGFAWHKLVGCRTGACPLTANPWMMTLYGAAVGAVIGVR